MIGPFLNFIPSPGLSQGAISGAYVSVVCLLLPVRSDWSVPKRRQVSFSSGAAIFSLTNGCLRDGF